jgi:hypothetical protein
VSANSQKVVVRKVDNVLASAPEGIDRNFLIELRRSLLQQLAVIEKKLDITRRCHNCGFDLSTR